MSDESKAQQIAAKIAELFPNLSAKEALAGPIAKAVLGKLPHYSGRKDYQISPTTTANAGAFILAHAYDESRRNPETGRMGAPVVVIIERSELTETGENRIGVPGGYVDLDKKESPAQGAVRELGEEVLDDAGKPVLSLDPNRLEPIVSGIDYRGNFGNAVAYNGFSVELTPPELTSLKAHCGKLQQDQDYAGKVKTASHGETNGVMLLDVARIPELAKDRFMHPHEYDALQKLAEKLLEPAPEKQR